MKLLRVRILDCKEKHNYSGAIRNNLESEKSAQYRSNENLGSSSLHSDSDPFLCADQHSCYTLTNVGTLEYFCVDESVEDEATPNTQ